MAENPFLFFYISKKCTCIIQFLNGSNSTLVILLDFLLLISSFGNFFSCQLSWRHCEMMLPEMRTLRSYIKTRDHFVQLKKGVWSCGCGSLWFSGLLSSVLLHKHTRIPSPQSSWGLVIMFRPITAVVWRGFFFWRGSDDLVREWVFVPLIICSLLTSSVFTVSE